VPSWLTVPKRLPVAGVIALETLAFWPVWRWYVARLLDKSDEPWPLVALITAVVLAAREKAPDARAVRGPAVFGLSVYALTFPVTPPLVHAVVAFATLALSLPRARPAVMGLFVLAAPGLASIDFFLGYPMRLVSGSIAAWLLRGSGYGVTIDGTLLRWGQAVLAIDAPCSGARMLWGATYLTLLAAAAARMTWARCAAALAAASALVILGNAMRSAELFFTEAGVVTAPRWVHAGVGLVVFALVAIAVLWAARSIGATEPVGGKL
jgi:exosortase/archaeosortase family protein